MKVDDQRNKKQELSFNELEAGCVYVSNRMQKYVMKMKDFSDVICLEAAQLYSERDCLGDSFTPVKATLLVE